MNKTLGIECVNPINGMTAYQAFLRLQKSVDSVVSHFGISSHEKIWHIQQWERDMRFLATLYMDVCQMDPEKKDTAIHYQQLCRLLYNWKRTHFRGYMLE